MERSIDHENGDNPYTYVPPSCLKAISGYSSIILPAGFIDELPIGLLFFADASFISIACDYEKRALARRPPKFLPTNEYLKEA
ncbi:MAG: hypothetical protein CMQ41_04240 [Gammaproteobacteria bacterium]|nr:hypothetical protein [Gammaproteobacteria bacterium]|tara:strand:+ start:37 stop:285 length:249 start_codon:yes stop_codon:yes gene_type:complete